MIRLGERAAAAAASLLSGKLPAALAEIQAADPSVELTAPEAWYLHERACARDDRCYGEVWVRTIDGFDRAGMASAAGRVMCRAALTVRITVVNRGPGRADWMEKALHRYAAAVVAVLTKNPTLGGTDDSVEFAAIDRVDVNAPKAVEAGTTQAVGQVRVALKATLIEIA